MTATYLLLLLLSVAHASPSFWDPQAIRRAVIPHGGGGSSSTPSTVAADEASTEEVLVADIPHGGSTATATSSARLLAKNQEETQSMSVSLPLGSSQLDNERDAPLMRDLELLSGILSNIVNTKEDAKVHDLYEEFRHYALIRANNDPIQGTEALQNMIQLAKELEPTQALGVVRTFSIMLNLVNAAEVHHRDRRMRQYQHDTEQIEQQNEQQNGEGGGAAAFGGPLPNVEDSMRGTMLALLKSNLATEQEIYQQLVTQKVEIVLTAHPTEVQRKSLLRKYRKITEALAQLDGPESGGAVSSSSNKSYYSTSYAQQAARQELEMTISSIWGADEIRRSKPTPQQEAAGGNAILESVLWDAVPAYLRKLDQQCQLTLHKRLPVDCSPIHFASWIGGDRDGNPNVTPFVTREVVLQQRLRATRLFLRDLYNLLSELAISYRFSPEMEELADAVYRDFPKHKREKYRRVCGYLIQRLVKTARECESELAQLSTYSTSSSSPAVSAVSGSSTVDAMTVVDEMVDGWQHVPAIHSVDELMKPLRIMYDSLVATGFELLADGLLADIIRRLAVFGCSLVPLDIREESTHHTLALDALTRWLGIGSYKEWSEEARLNWLNSELASKRPLFGIDQLDELGFDDDVKTTLKTFKMASELRTEDLGAYVISQAQTASDVLAVMLLQKQFGMGATSGKMMRVVPLFETLNDLTNAPQVLDTLFSIPLYIGAVRGKQEVMVGYSDSAKDAGRLSACWAQYVSQENMSQCADKHGVELTFFHGKGGTVGRGGNPSVYRAIMSHPPNTINGRFRVTEQGEMIAQNFGAPSIAERTLDIYTAAVCREAFVKHVDPSEKWRSQMEKISQVSCDDYRYLVREEPRFVPYFRQATPELELGSLNIGSRPAKRKPQGGIESLRAIPWTFAWAQTRTHLSAWLGVGAGLQHDDEELKTLREMYKEWPWFRETIDLIAMIVSKTDYSIAENYDKQLVDPKDTDLLGLGVEVREKLVQTRQAVLDVTESKDVAGAHVALMRASSTIRHPYVDPVNVIQAELLKRVREMESRQDSLSPKELEDLEILKDALVISINGIAQGMRNSG